ncbi:unnamed protein product [Pelagomonas calceolata]|uniref:Uncharacterized protein n=1 Tax=Pelagomonas calceolata TaxID=35677 RepID=A0A8J2SNS3_9STRA|nr:unnamed protein product [Pelagomonas calceolata]
MRVSIKTGHNWISSAALDALREVEAGLRHELGLAAAEHGEDADVARARRLGREADDAEHREAAVLDLLELLLGVLLGRVVEAERVPAARALAEAEVAGHVGRVLELVHAVDFERGHERQDLVPAGVRDRVDGLERVHLAEGAVLAREVGDLREDPAQARELGDAAVHELGLAEDLERAVALVPLPPRARRVLREAERVEAHVAHQRAVEVRRRERERDRRVGAAARLLRRRGRRRLRRRLLLEDVAEVEGRGRRQREGDAGLGQHGDLRGTR